MTRQRRWLVGLLAVTTLGLPAGLLLGSGGGPSSIEGLASAGEQAVRWTGATAGETTAPATTTPTSTTVAPPSSTTTSSTTTSTTTAPTTTSSTTTSTTSTLPPSSEGDRVLMFVAYNDVWWSEYKVMYETLDALGYDVDVRSSADGSASTYQLGLTLDEWSDHPTSGGTHAGFVDAFEERTGEAWTSTWNDPAPIPIDGLIQDVASLDAYEAFVLVGGTGAIDYLYDGTYEANTSDHGGDPGHVSDAAAVEEAAIAIDELVNDAIERGVPVIAQCHGAALVSYARIDGTTGGPGDLGTSVLEGRSATGYHLGDGDTAARLASLGVTYLPDRSVVVDGPDPALVGGSHTATSRIVTTRDWAPQTVLHGASTLHAIMRTYPSDVELAAAHNVLVLHGGAVDPSDCQASNQSNDVPCNWGVADLPADFTHLEALLAADSPADDFDFTVSDLDLTEPGALPFDPDAPGDLRAHLDAQSIDVVVYFEHWGHGTTDEIQSDLTGFADDGGGLVAFHHGLYNQGGNIDLLATAFGAESNLSDWGGSTDPRPGAGPYGFLATGYGHFIATHAIDHESTMIEPPFGDGFPASMPGHPSQSSVVNPNANGLPFVELHEEIYANTTFLGSPDFGSGVGQIDTFLANDAAAFSPDQTLTAGFAKRFDPSGDDTVGRLAYVQPGETRSSYEPTSPLGQMFRNAVAWAADADA
jgi:putative intracellular protease/amidase